MDEMLYDDKLAGDIDPEKYQIKHKKLQEESKELLQKLSEIDLSLEQQLDKKLILLELSQKAYQIYPYKSPEQKRIIIKCLFEELVFDTHSVSVTYTNFTRAIAQKVLLTREIIGGAK